MTVLTPSEAVRACLRAGWRVRRGKHWIVYPPDGGTPVVFPATPSDRRGVRNLRAALRRAGLRV